MRQGLTKVGYSLSAVFNTQTEFIHVDKYSIRKYYSRQHFPGFTPRRRRSPPPLHHECWFDLAPQVRKQPNDLAQIGRRAENLIAHPCPKSYDSILQLISEPSTRHPIWQGSYCSRPVEIELPWHPGLTFRLAQASSSNN